MVTPIRKTAIHIFRRAPWQVQKREENEQLSSGIIFSGVKTSFTALFIHPCMAHISSSLSILMGWWSALIHFSNDDVFIPTFAEPLVFYVRKISPFVGVDLSAHNRNPHYLSHQQIACNKFRFHPVWLALMIFLIWMIFLTFPLNLLYLQQQHTANGRYNSFAQLSGRHKSRDIWILY